MAVVNQVKKVVRMELWEIIHFQIHVYCYLNKIQVTEQNEDCLTLLALVGDMELQDFCDEAAKKGKFKTSQSARTSLPILEKKNLLVTYKIGKDKKRVKLHDNIKVQASGNILLDYKIVHVEPTAA